jgi:transcription elongation GreA/GreB family factor
MATVEKMPMLQEGHDRLNADLKRLKAERPTIVDAIEEARAHGDLSENAEYHAAKERQGQIEASISDIEDRLSRAQVIDPTELSGDLARRRRQAGQISDRWSDRGRRQGWPHFVQFAAWPCVDRA